MARATAHLIERQGPHPNRAYSVTKSKTTIGRSQRADLRVPGPEVSRLHAQILLEGNAFSIEDLGSTNGTFVNGERITGPASLKEGDLIDLGGSVRLLFTPSIADRPDDLSTPKPGHRATVPAPGSLEPSASSPAAQIKDAEIEKALRSNRRRWAMGCGCGLLLAMFLCGAILFFLNAYEGGRLLYCGPLQPLFETLSSPLGFSPACPTL